MKPVAVFQHSPEAGPGYFADWLAEQGIPMQLLRVDRGDSVPMRADAFSGLCFMGGPMSVNDPLPWIEAELRLIRDAVARRIPVIGHCLGGQLLAKAIGGSVARSPVKEIGWGRLRVTNAAIAREWLGSDAADAPEFFQWHGDTFTLPPGAVNFLASDLCANQAFVLERNGCAHLGMQFHCEMTPALVRDWALDADSAREIAEERRQTGGPGVNDADAMLREVAARTAAMNALAARLYARWTRGLR
ncbi:MAG: type 1 glutamine amidotransferase [Gemmatimonadota bacterium]